MCDMGYVYVIGSYAITYMFSEFIRISRVSKFHCDTCYLCVAGWNIIDDYVKVRFHSENQLCKDRFHFEVQLSRLSPFFVELFLCYMAVVWFRTMPKPNRLLLVHSF